MGYWHSDCPACQQGRLLVVKIRQSGQLFLLCEECECAWLSPEDISLDTHFDFQDRAVTMAEQEDIERAGWFRYALNRCKA